MNADCGGFKELRGICGTSFALHLTSSSKIYMYTTNGLSLVYSYHLQQISVLCYQFYVAITCMGSPKNIHSRFLNNSLAKSFGDIS